MIPPELKLKLLLNILEEISEKYDEILKENKKLLEELHKQATTDHLTGLLNRRALLQALRREVERIKSNHHKNTLCICFMDLDNFKLINDTLGHEEGDRVLRNFASILKKILKPYDIVGRWGGDEFVAGIINCEYFDKPEVCRSCPYYQKLSEEIKRLGKCYAIPLGVSCGVSKIPAETLDLEEALRVADRRLYIAKKTGRGKIVVDNNP